MSRQIATLERLVSHLRTGFSWDSNDRGVCCFVLMMTGFDLWRNYVPGIQK